MDFTLYVEGWLHPTHLSLVEIWTFVDWTLFFVFVGGNTEGHSHFYCGHDKPFYFFVFDGLYDIYYLLLLGIFRSGELRFVLVGVVLESL